jgi:hypothetical protein
MANESSHTKMHIRWVIHLGYQPYIGVIPPGHGRQQKRLYFEAKPTERFSRSALIPYSERISRRGRR